MKKPHTRNIEITIILFAVKVNMVFSRFFLILRLQLIQPIMWIYPMRIVRIMLYSRNRMKYFWLCDPLQLLIHSQWWSILKTHVSHREQWCALGGFQLSHFLHDLPYKSGLVAYNLRGIILIVMGPGLVNTALS